MKRLGLQPSIHSREKFFAALKEGYSSALDRLESTVQFAPGPKLLQETHETMFSGILKSAGKFRGKFYPRETAAGELLCPAEEIGSLLHANARKNQSLVRAKNPTQVEMIANYLSTLMEVRPFEDISGGNFINRTMAAVVLEAQLENCFGAHSIKRNIEAKAFNQALNWRLELASRKKLEAIVKKMAGSGYNVLKMEKWRRKDYTQEHEY